MIEKRFLETCFEDGRSFYFVIRDGDGNGREKQNKSLIVKTRVLGVRGTLLRGKFSICP